MFLLWRVVVIIVVVACSQVAFAQLSLKTETKRRLQHALTGFLLVQVSYVLPLIWCVVALMLGTTALAYVRYCHDDLYLQAFGPLLRAKERQPGVLPGAFYFLLGTTLTAVLFPLSHARYAVTCLSLADPMASWAGQSIRSPKIHASSSISGCMACFFTAAAVGVVYLSTLWGFDKNTTVLTTAAANPKIWVGALACTIAESLPFGNDNLLIPVMTGAAVTYYGSS